MIVRVLKRLRWMLLGSLFGAGGSVWLKNRYRYLANRYAPVRGTVTVAGAARRVSRDLRDAWSDGRKEMKSTETRLKDSRFN
jgi:hypothetical protein